MLKIFSLLAVLLFATPALAGGFNNEKPSENIIDLTTQCPQGTETQAIMSHKAQGNVLLFVKKEKIKLFEQKVNENRATFGKEPRALDGVMLAIMNDRMWMAYQFHEGCVIHAVMAPNELLTGAFQKMGITEDDWE
jgi:hypothetical protein